MKAMGSVEFKHRSGHLLKRSAAGAEIAESAEVRERHGSGAPTFLPHIAPRNCEKEKGKTGRHDQAAIAHRSLPCVRIGAAVNQREGAD